MAFYFENDGRTSPGTAFKNNPDGFKPVKSLDQAYEKYLQRIHGATLNYSDTNHLSMLFPEVMSLLLGDLQKLKLISFEIDEISATYDHEFFVHLRKSTHGPVISEEEFYERRQSLLRSISRQLGEAPYTQARRWWGIPRRYRRWLDKRN